MNAEDSGKTDLDDGVEDAFEMFIEINKNKIRQMDLGIVLFTRLNQCIIIT